MLLSGVNNANKIMSSASTGRTSIRERDREMAKERCISRAHGTESGSLKIIHSAGRVLRVLWSPINAS
jgi:hypothetical protein